MTARALLLLGALCVLAGCDSTDIVPPASQNGAYTLWGALDPTTNVQTVRVVDVTDTLRPTSPDPLPVRVVSVDVQTGRETAWRDSLVAFADGSFGHVYRAAFRPAYGQRYRLVVRRDADGGEVSAETTVPPRVEPTVRPASLADGVRVPIVWDGAPQLNRVRVRYTVQRDDTCQRVPVELALTDASGTAERVGDTWTVTLNLLRIVPVLRDLVVTRQTPGVGLGLREVTVRAEIADAGWRPPGGIFDVEVFAAPEVFDNVDGGFGFVGSAYRTVAAFAPTQADLARTSFVDTAARCGAFERGVAGHAAAERSEAHPANPSPR